MEILVGKGTEGSEMGIAVVIIHQEAVSAVSSVLSHEEEKAHFETARRLAEIDLKALSAKDGIFAAHLEMLKDPMLDEYVGNGISSGLSASAAVKSACESIAAMFKDIDDEYLKARADDVRDVCKRILDYLDGTSEHLFQNLPKDSVIVADQLFPSEMASLDFSRVRAIVLQVGSVTSHVCILAHNKGIPAVVGVEGCISKIVTGNIVIVRPALKGEGYEVIVDPSIAAKKCFLLSKAYDKAMQDAAVEDRFKPAVGLDGAEYSVMANAGNVEEVRVAVESGADGIGLFRSEFLFMESSGWPSEETQFEAYREAALLCKGKPLTIRTLDIGGDKSLPYMQLGHEDNPFLGLRAIRISLGHPEIFKKQLRAILRASAFGEVRILLPMIAMLSELDDSRKLIQECQHELLSEGVKFDENIKVGIMVETPAAVFSSSKFAGSCAFFSLGTNDLTQYIMAADRGNPSVAYLYNSLDSAVLKAIEMTVESAGNIPVCVCGEMAAMPQAVKALASLDIRTFSVAPSAIPRLKHLLREL